MEIDGVSVLERRRGKAQSRITSTSSATLALCAQVFRPRGSVQACLLVELSERRVA